MSLLEACAGTGFHTVDGTPGACTYDPAVSTNFEAIRLVFTPANQTAPTVLAMVNTTSHTTEYVNNTEAWIGDFQTETNWTESISFSDALGIYMKYVGDLTKGGEVLGF